MDIDQEDKRATHVEQLQGCEDSGNVQVVTSQGVRDLYNCACLWMYQISEWMTNKRHDGRQNGQESDEGN